MDDIFTNAGENAQGTWEDYERMIDAAPSFTEMADDLDRSGVFDAITPAKMFGVQVEDQKYATDRTGQEYWGEEEWEDYVARIENMIVPDQVAGTGHEEVLDI